MPDTPEPNTSMWRAAANRSPTRLRSDSEIVSEVDLRAVIMRSARSRNRRCSSRKSAVRAPMMAANQTPSVLRRLARGTRLGAPQPPLLLILDEPTNHLDIESLEAVEAGLRGFDGALLVVSHDAAFLDAIGVERRVELGG